MRSCSAGVVRASGDEVEQQHEHARPLDVAEELVAEAPSLARPLDEAREVGHDELGVVVQSDHAEVAARGW